MSWGTKETYIYFRDYALTDETQGNACAWPASKFLGIDLLDATRTIFYFEATIGKATVDTITITHTEGKHKELCEALSVALNSDKTNLVVFADKNNDNHDLLTIKLGVGISSLVIEYGT